MGYLHAGVPACLSTIPPTNSPCMVRMLAVLCVAPLQEDLSAPRRSTPIWPWKWYISCLNNAPGIPFIGFRLTFGTFLTSPQHDVASALRSCSQLAQTCLCEPWLRMRSTPRRWHKVAQSIGMATYTIEKANAGAQTTIPIF